MSAICNDCGLVYDGFDGHMVMLHDSLWRRVSRGKVKICLCDHCIQKRLGRSITPEDLIPGVFVNEKYINQHKLNRNQKWQNHLYTQKDSCAS